MNRKRKGKHDVRVVMYCFLYVLQWIQVLGFESITSYIMCCYYVKFCLDTMQISLALDANPLVILLSIVG